jgi:outer membrane protein TolC
VNVRQLITDFGRTRSAVALVKSGEITALDALEQTRHQLGYQAIQSFYAVMLLRQSVSVAEEEIRSLNESLRITDQKFSGGRATKFDVLTTKVRIANAENRRTDMIASLHKQEASLRQLLGFESDSPLTLVGDFDSPTTRPELSATLATGLQSRPEIKLARDAEKTAQLKFEVADRTDRPTLSADVTGGVRNGDLPAIFDRTEYVAAGVSVAVPIFNGHRTDGKRIEARADLRSAQAHTKEIIRSITTDVESAFADLTASEARLSNADALVAQAQEALDQAKTRSTSGVITNFELLDAQSSARAAELTRVQARYDYVLARHAVAQAAGQPPKG